MRLCTFSAAGGVPRPGRIEGDRVVELAADSLVAVLEAGGAAPVREHALADVRLRAPIPEPPSVRDFFAFEQHVATARANRGARVPAEWYEIPVFYFSNPAAIYGPEDAIPYPQGTAELDYELEVAAVIGGDARIAGFSVLNDWSARDLQRQEVRVGLGPAKGKDFATSLGPVLVTVDEFAGGAAEMVARVNGEERSRGNLADLHYSWGAILERAALNTRLRAGDVIGSGTVGTGCILEADDGRWLQVDDVVELEVAGLGVLRNTVAPPR
jgi:fumarylacetoacetate (FAA) hydrolase